MLAPPFLEGLLAWAAAHPEQTATILVAIVGSVGHYSRTGRLPLGRLPYRALQDSFGELTDQYFGIDRPRGVPGLIVETTTDELEVTLRANYFESADDYSFEYDGEVLNFRRPNSTRPHPTTGRPVPMELHPRAFELSTGDLLVICHDEASRAEAWGDHIRERLLSWERGRNDIKEVLHEAGVDYDAIPSERQAGVEVVS